MLTITKTKIGVASLILASFVVGGIAFNAYQVGAFEGFHRFGFFGGGCDLSGLEKGSAEWQTKVDACKAEKQAKMEEFKALTPEERQAKMEELKTNLPENFGRKGHGFIKGECDDACKAERQAKMEERKAQMEAWKNMTPEERQAKMEGLKANWPHDGELKKGQGFGFGHFMGFREFRGMPSESN